MDQSYDVNDFVIVTYSVVCRLDCCHSDVFVPARKFETALLNKKKFYLITS